MCNPKCHLPNWGNNRWDRFFFILTCISFVLAIVELPALFKYLSFFRSGLEERGCCGIINEVSSPDVDGVACHEEGIVNSNINFTDIYLNETDAVIRYCTVGGVVCNTWGNFSIDTCMEKGPFKVEHICSVAQIQAATDGISTAVLWIWIAAIVLIATMLHIVSECFGCYESCPGCTKFCGTPQNQCCCKSFEMLVWIAVLGVVTVYVENASNNGYVNTEIEGHSLQQSDVDGIFDAYANSSNASYEFTELEATRWLNRTSFSFLQQQCGLSESILWIDFSDSISGWVTSAAYSAVAVIGTILAVIDFFCFCGWYYMIGKHRKNNQNDVNTTGGAQQNTQTAIQMSPQQPQTQTVMVAYPGQQQVVMMPQQQQVVMMQPQQQQVVYQPVYQQQPVYQVAQQY